MAELVDADRMPEQGAAQTTLQVASDSSPASRPREGLVVATSHGFYEVFADDATYLCTLRGRLRKSRPAQPPARTSHAKASRPGRPSQPARAAAAVPTLIEEGAVKVVAGDRVLFLPLGGDQGIIEDVLPRRTTLSRARSESGSQHVMLANLDHAVLVFAMREPAPHFGMLDRYLALCEHAGVEVTICLNKVDLGMPPEVEEEAALYAGLGYRMCFTSATSAAGLDELRAQLVGRTSLLTGPSGVGKSSLMNDLVPHASQRTGEISGATGKGRHTTTGVRLLPLGEGGWLADSAGIRELALWNVPAEELPRCFVELRPVAGDCLYENCDHSEGEEGCALRETLAAGRITSQRFASFERLLAEAREAEQPRW